MTTTESVMASPMLATAVLDAAIAAAGGTVYLLHFDRPYKHAAHYTGWTLHLDQRLHEHDIGHGARLTEVVRDAGIGWQLARIWPGDRRRERALKRQGGASRRCPMCGYHPRTDNQIGEAA